jgi:gamma-glutamylputrescine oxidase
MTAHWLATSAPLASSTNLPDRVDIAIIGGGIAGLAVAAELAEGGASVALLEARDDLAASISGRDAGLALTGLGDNPYRLTASLGEKTAGEITAFTLENLDLIDKLGQLDRTGGLAIGLRNEIGEIPLTVAAAKAIGLDAELWDAEQVNAALSSTGLGPARYIPAEGLIDPRALATALAKRARAAGAILKTGCPVRETTEDDGVLLHYPDGVLKAELVVLAAGSALTGLDPFLGDKLYPVRTQLLSLPAPARRFTRACSALFGYYFWRQAPDGTLIIGGCRWATPNMEVGETDDSVTVPIIEQRIRSFIDQTFPDLAAVPTAARWSAIMSFTCDGLPILGPIPGRSRFVVCTGFNGRQYGLALRAAQAVSQGMLTGTAAGVPSCFKTGRFVG